MLCTLFFHYFAFLRESVFFFFISRKIAYWFFFFFSFLIVAKHGIYRQRSIVYGNALACVGTLGREFVDSFLLEYRKFLVQGCVAYTESSNLSTFHGFMSTKDIA